MASHHDTYLDQYFVLVDNQATGPYSVEELYTRYRNHQVSRDTLVCLMGAEQWQRLDEVLLIELESIQTQSPARLNVSSSLIEASPVDRPPSQSDSHFWGKTISAFLLPMVGLLMGYFGWLLAGLGIYNAFLAVRASAGETWRKNLAGTAAVMSCCMGLLCIVISLASPADNTVTRADSNGSSNPSNVSRPLSQEEIEAKAALPAETGQRTYVAWVSLNSVVQMSHDLHKDDSGNLRMKYLSLVDAIDAIETQGIDVDLKNYIQEIRAIQTSSAKVVRLIEADAAKIGKDWQTGAGLMGILLGALGAQNERDPIGGALQGGMIAGELANQGSQAAMADMMKRHEPAIQEIESRTVSAYSTKFTQLHAKLTTRYGIEFPWNIE